MSRLIIEAIERLNREGFEALPHEHYMIYFDYCVKNTKRYKWRLLKYHKSFNTLSDDQMYDWRELKESAIETN